MNLVGSHRDRAVRVAIRMLALFALVCATTLPGCARSPANAVVHTPDRLPAFPGAEGFGAFTKGGRGGKVLHVTSLEDYRAGDTPIPGTLRAAVETEGPRMILFRVSGYVELERPLEIREPNVTIAGQTAPGDGIAIRNFGLDIWAPEVVIRHLRIRPGDVSGQELDAINIRSSNVIVDHCSASWATDETVSVIGEATNVTVQWSLIAESLNESVHSKGEHGYGSLISTSGDVTIHHNIYAFHKSRNPRPRDALLDFRNNLIYGWGDRAGYNADDRTRMNYVANVLQPLGYSGNPDYAFSAGGTDAQLFLRDNVLRLPDGAIRRDWELIDPPDDLPQRDAEVELGVPLPFATPSVTTHDPEDLPEMLLEDAGATRPVRDAVDRRIVRLMRSGTGAIIDSQEDVGGWPEMRAATPPADTDQDGMPDSWEERFGLDPNDANDHAGDLDGDGYTNLEEFLNGSDPTEQFGWLAPPSINPPNGTAFTEPALSVSITGSEPDLTVRYTTDGAEPSHSSARYDGPIAIENDAHVRAVSNTERPTTAAFAAYERLEWIEAETNVPATIRPGLRYAVYQADDWDEGAAIENLDPVDSGASEKVDFEIRPKDGYNAIVFDGWLEVPRDGIYEFYLQDDVRSRLFVGNAFVTQGRPSSGSPGRVALRSGLHRFHLRSLHEEPRPSSLEWRGPDTDRGPIPARTFAYIPED